MGAVVAESESYTGTEYLFFKIAPQFVMFSNTVFWIVS